jgi:hypothetical protein
MEFSSPIPFLDFSATVSVCYLAIKKKTKRKRKERRKEETERKRKNGRLICFLVFTVRFATWPNYSLRAKNGV